MESKEIIRANELSRLVEKQAKSLVRSRYARAGMRLIALSKPHADAIAERANRVSKTGIFIYFAPSRKTVKRTWRIAKI